MTVVLLVHPKINCMTIPPAPVNYSFRTIPPCGNFSNHISQTFPNQSYHWFKLNDVMQVLRLFHCATQLPRRQTTSKQWQKEAGLLRSKTMIDILKKDCFKEFV